MTPPLNPQHDPSPVFKFIAGMALAIVTAILVGLAIFKGRDFNGWLVAAAAIPSFVALIMMSDTIRDWVLKVADKLPFVRYTTPKE